MLYNDQRPSKWARYLVVALILSVAVGVILILAFVRPAPTVGTTSSSSFRVPSKPNANVAGGGPPFYDGSTPERAIVDTAFYNATILGYGPAGHNFLFRSAQISKLIVDATGDVAHTGRKYLVLEKEAYRPGRCGKIDDVPVPHYKGASDFAANNCKFDESCRADGGACPINDNYHQDVARAIRSIDNEQWYWGLGPLRFIKNGDNEPSRCMINEFNIPAFCTRFKPTYFTARGAREDNVNYNNTLQNAFRYTFPNPKQWNQTSLDNLLCNVYCEVGKKGRRNGFYKGRDHGKGNGNAEAPNTNTCSDCGTTLDDYLLRYAIGRQLENGSPDALAGMATNIHPFTGENCTALGNCPMKTCHTYQTLHHYYAGILGWTDPATGARVPNYEAAEHILEFNVGYIGDGYGAHEPCAYNEWNAIEYTTFGEFCYMGGSMSGICRKMNETARGLINDLGGSLTVHYNMTVVSADLIIDGANTVIAVIARNSQDSKYYRFNTIKETNNEVLFALTPGVMRELSGNLPAHFKKARAPQILHPIHGTPRGGSRFMDQAKGASPYTANVITDKPYFAFLMEQTNQGHYHMSIRGAGRQGYHSRSEMYNDPRHRRDNIGRAIYSDFHHQNEWLALETGIQLGYYNDTDIKERIAFNWRLQFPNEKNILKIKAENILEVYHKHTIDGWCWQTPGNHNTPAQYSAWAASPTRSENCGNQMNEGYDCSMLDAGIYGMIDVSDLNVGLVGSSYDLSRDGWVSGAWHQNGRYMRNTPFYQSKGTFDAHQYWEDKLFCGLRPGGFEGHPEDTDGTVALHNEFPHVYHAETNSYTFPDGDATYGPYIGVTIKKFPNGTYEHKPCAYDPALRECTNAAYNTLPAIPCSPKTPASPYM